MSIYIYYFWTGSGETSYKNCASAHGNFCCEPSLSADTISTQIVRVLLVHNVLFQHILADEGSPTQLSLDVNDALLFFVGGSVAEDQIHILESLFHQ